MSKGRFTLLSLFGAVTFAAVACAALVNPSVYWASAFWTIALLIVASLSLGCFFGPKQSRAFCVGFAFFGWGHLVLVFGPWFEDHSGELLATRQIVDYVGVKLGYDSDPCFPRSVWFAAHAKPANQFAAYHAFTMVGQSFMTLVVALLGGVIGRWLARRRPDERAESA